ncbi:MAG: patatin-like phospholipase family protein [Cyclobacteriaceae bacterium]|nr:patatin-like phospholipase family protein [Cyclobacteriaceae bacterium]
MRPCFFLLLLLISSISQAQKVAVVMSGGAAKGMAHIGMLKALEENEIPIDYVVGTSMGGIIAGCYAAGMSPAYIEELMLQEDLTRWINGQLEKGYNYYYNKNDDHPSFVRLNLSLDSTFSVNLNSSIANDLALNFAIAEKMAQPSAIAKGNFDSLFVPLRVVAAEIFTQQEVILKKGNLNDALRATQTVPFFYNPIRIDGRYLFDGGVYNNFPVDVAEKEFNPEVIIGCNVSSKVYDEYPSKEDDQLISKSLIYLFLDKSDPSQVPSTGVYIQPNLKNYTGFDFARTKALIDSGYTATMRLMPEIKAKIAQRRTCEEVAIARNKFNNRTSPLLVDKVIMNGFNSHQTRYLNRLFNSGRRPLYFNDIKSGYYRLVSEDYFRNVYPGFLFDNQSQRFNFQLTKRPQNNFQVDFGGVIATRNVSSIFLGFNYYYFNRLLTHASANFYVGSFYKSAQVKARLDFPNLNQFYLEPEATFNNFNFLEGREIILLKSKSTVLDRTDRKIGMSLGIPLGRQYKAVLGGHFITNEDQYINRDFLIATDTLDKLQLTGGRFGFHILSNNLNRKQYASSGKSFDFGVDWFDLNEQLIPGSTSVLKNTLPDGIQRTWFRGSLVLEQYFKKGIYSSGYLFHANLSNQPTFTNYNGTIINAPGFFPFQDSRTLLLQNFRSVNFVAGGWRNVFALRKNIDFRLEGHLFKPFQAISQGQQQEPILSEIFEKIYFAGTAGFVMHSTVGPVSLSFNYYDDKENQFGVLLHVGYLLFNKSSLE